MGKRQVRFKTSNVTKPVFFDSTGSRWLFIRVYFLAILFLMLIALARFVPEVLKPVKINGFDSASQTYKKQYLNYKSPENIAYSSETNNIPEIGSGTLLRIVKIIKSDGQLEAIDPFSGLVTKKLSADEISTVGNHKYAVELYGPEPKKVIALTFDDGPDSYYTNEILNILSEEKAPATFFSIGANIAKYPELSKRIVKEGHLLANHTFSHIDFDYSGSFRSRQDINQSQRLIRFTTGKNPTFFRVPYSGPDTASIKTSLKGILEAQQMGYVISSYNLDSNDWRVPLGEKTKMPNFDGRGLVILLHDAGGNRDATLVYLKDLIAQAKKHGYKFLNLENYYGRPDLNEHVSPGINDRFAFYFAELMYVWPKKLVHLLFVISVLLIFISLFVNVALAGIQNSRSNKKKYKLIKPFVSVIVPAFNEEKVLAKTIRSLAKSNYKKFEVIIVDDGSKDHTLRVINKIIKNPRLDIKALHQKNAGKSGAVNRALTIARGEIIISIDADTTFPPDVIDLLVRHFEDEEVGAVAGTVKVGNISNVITRIQALEYITSIHLERTAQAFLNAIMIAPGACSAWRKEAIFKAGGYSSSTLAEDCDLTLAVTKQGYKVVQDLEAIAYTESPKTITGLLKQRFRWTFGSIQSIWKHRDMMFKKRYKWLGFYVLPKNILSLVLQIIFAPIVLLVTIGNIITGEFIVVASYFLLTNVLLILTSIIAIIFAKERFAHILVTPFYRSGFNPLKTMLIYQSVLSAIGGTKVGWNKVGRTGTVNKI